MRFGSSGAGAKVGGKGSEESSAGKTNGVRRGRSASNSKTAHEQEDQVSVDESDVGSKIANRGKATKEKRAETRTAAAQILDTPQKRANFRLTEPEKENMLAVHTHKNGKHTILLSALSNRVRTLYIYRDRGSFPYAHNTP